MGGRGGSSRMSSGGASVANVNTKFTSRELSSMGRSQLESVARAVFIKQNMARGLTAEEASRRAGLLMNSNTDAQLRKYIKRHG